MLEIWAEGEPAPLAMWPLHTDASELDADSYADVKLTLTNVGIYDENRESWKKSADRWSAPVLPRPWT